MFFSKEDIIEQYKKTIKRFETTIKILNDNIIELEKSKFNIGDPVFCTKNKMPVIIADFQVNNESDNVCVKTIHIEEGKTSYNEFFLKDLVSYNESVHLLYRK